MAQRSKKTESSRKGRLAEYVVRVSARARHVHLRLSLHNGLEVVVPKGYDKRQIPTVIAQKRAWLERNLRRLRDQRDAVPDDHFAPIPAQIQLRAVNQGFRLMYRSTVSARMVAEEQGNTLTLVGDTSDHEACRRTLREWLADKGRKVLIPWLERTSSEIGLSYTKVTIRGQKTRWGSCSARKSISLNYKLLFLPSEQVHYLLVHELCHTRHLNHSAQYWALVERKLPQYRRLDTALREAWRYVPLWAGL